MNITLRKPDEIQRAHDQIMAIITGEVPEPPHFDAGDRRHWHAILDCLCWVLRHDHNVTMEGNLRALDKAMEEMGYRLQPIEAVDAPVPSTGVEDHFDTLPPLAGEGT